MKDGDSDDEYWDDEEEEPVFERGPPPARLRSIVEGCRGLTALSITNGPRLLGADSAAVIAQLSGLHTLHIRVFDEDVWDWGIKGAGMGAEVRRAVPIPARDTTQFRADVRGVRFLS